jgi:hypothetical protein
VPRLAVAPGEGHIRATYPWDAVWSTVEEKVPRRYAELLVEQAVEWIAGLCANRSACYAWSAVRTLAAPARSGGRHLLELRD